MSAEGWRVVRILRIAVDDTVHTTHTEAQAARDWLAQEYPDQSLAIAHTTLPLDGFVAPRPDDDG